MNVKNVLSLAAIFKSAVRDEGCNQDIDDCLLCNIDATTVEYVQSEKGTECRVLRGSQATTTGSSQLAQRFKLLSCKYASGGTAPVVVVLKETDLPVADGIQKLKVRKLSPDAGHAGAFGWLWIVSNVVF